MTKKLRQRLFSTIAQASAAILVIFGGTEVGLKADTLIGSSSFSSGGSYTVPAGTNYIVISAAGGGGGTGVLTPGGDGAIINASYAVSPGLSLSVVVGTGGDGYETGGSPGGGSSGGLGGAGGGGYSSVSGTGVLVVAGAGGGGGNAGSYGGGGGQPNGGSAAYNTNNGATQSQGGYGDTGTDADGEDGSQWQGGDVGSSSGGYQGGGGGGGYYGGGGGACGEDPSAGDGGSGGGGGSSIATGSAYNVSYGDAGNGGAYGVYNSASDGWVTIYAYQSVPVPTITSSTSTLSYAQNQSVSYTITASNSPTSYSASGLPPGVSVDTSTGAITGAPSSGGSYTSTISATNSYGTGSATLDWTIAGATFANNPTVSPSSITYGGSVTLQPSGTASLGVAWIENSIFTPSGAGIPLGNQYGADANNAISYTPVSGGGTYYYRTRVVDNYSNYNDQYVAFTVVATPAVTSSTAVQVFQVGQTASYTVTASGGGTISYSATGLPPGLSINSSTGVISGTAAAVGSFTSTITVTNSAGTSSVSLTWTISPLVSTGTMTNAVGPASSLIQGQDGYLYGATENGGAYNSGVIFKVEPDGSNYQVIHTLGGTLSDSTPDGSQIVCPLVQGSGSDQHIYAATWGGGTYGLGTIVQFNPDGSDYTVIVECNGGAATSPNYLSYLNYLILGADGELYGVSYAGGQSGVDGNVGYGCIFKVNTDGSDVEDLHDFHWGTDDDYSSQPQGLIQDPDTGILYGTTYSLSSEPNANYGTVFRLNTDGSGYSQVCTPISYTDSSTGQGFLSAPNIFTVSGVKYIFVATAYGQSSTGDGSLLSMPIDGTSSTAPTVVHEFNRSDEADGGQNTSSFVLASDGYIYGTSSVGGAYGYGDLVPGDTDFGQYPNPQGDGTVWRIKPDGSDYSVVYNFNAATDGANPYGGLVVASNGLLYGMLYQDTAGTEGALYVIPPGY